MRQKLYSNITSNHHIWLLQIISIVSHSHLNGYIFGNRIILDHIRHIELIAAGDKAAFKIFYEYFKAKVYNTAISYLQNAEEAEEITQDVFVEIFHSAITFKGESSPSTWVYRITINKCLDALRYRKRKKRFGFLSSLFGDSVDSPELDIPHFDHPGIALENKENASILFGVIDLLPENQKTAFILSQLEELPQKEIADTMQLSQKAVESLIQRAKANLRNNLEKFYPDRRK